MYVKSFRNVFHKKINLKTHLFIKSISWSLQKFRQYDKNLTKHQAKINTAIDTNQLKLQKKRNFKILKGIVYYKK